MATAIVIGAGIAGLAAGISLDQAGWDVELYEQADELATMGAALSIWPNAVAALDQLGCGEAFRTGAPRLERFGACLASGVPVMFTTVADAANGASAWLPSRTWLQSVLLRRFGAKRVALSHRVENFSADAHGVKAWFANGREARGDLLIAADGIWSRIANDILGVAPHHAGYGGLLGMAPPMAELPDRAAGIEYWGYRERFGLFDHGSAGKYWFYMCNEPDGPAAAALTNTEIMARLAGWPPHLREVVMATGAEATIPFSVHAKPPPRRLGRGRVVCVGDASHAMEPNLGQGACQALEDAVALGEAARGQAAMAILPVFERMRLKRVRKFVSASAQGSLIMHRHPALLQLARLPAVRWLAGEAVRWRLPDYFQMPSLNR